MIFKNGLKLSVLVFGLFLLAGCNRVLIRDYNNLNVPSGLTVEQVRAEIVKAGSSRNWVFTDTGEGQMLGELTVRAHYVAVNVGYSADQYSITYQTSSNMNADTAKKDRKIHKKYNGWVSNLVNDTKMALQQRANSE